MKNANGRLTRLEQRILRTAPAQDYREMPAYLAMGGADRDALDAYAARFAVEGHLRGLSDEDLDEFARLLMPFSNEPRDDTYDG